MHDLADGKLLTGKGNAATRAGEPRQPDKGGSRQRRGRIGRLELEMPGDRLGKARLGDAQHDRHCRIAGARAERDLQIQGIDIGQRDQAVRRIEIAQIERRVAAGVPGQQVEALLARPFDDGRIRSDFDDDEVLAESEQQVDHLAADAAGAANDDVSATMHRAQPLHPDPMHPRQQRRAESDEEAGNDGARQHQQHGGDDIAGIASAQGSDRRSRSSSLSRPRNRQRRANRL